MFYPSATILFSQKISMLFYSLLSELWRKVYSLQHSDLGNSTIIYTRLSFQLLLLSSEGHCIKYRIKMEGRVEYAKEKKMCVLYNCISNGNFFQNDKIRKFSIDSRIREHYSIDSIE